jgi:hypothetical protein
MGHAAEGDKPMQPRQLSNVLATWAAVLTAIATAYGFLQAYRDSVSKQVDDRHKQTFDLIRQFASKDFMPVREKALAVVRAAERCESAPVRSAAMSESEAFAFVEFFDLLQVCLDAQLCEAKLVDQFFVPYANGHWAAFKKYVMQVRDAEAKAFKVDKPFGYGLEKLGQGLQRVVDCPTLQR